ncbi:MAG TPA: HAMP domain-containing sensor histidine kinase [Solirubrobacteraceae bacterium]|nr:HAMP domain-containing sensor histidine kinase [Solirubrobacteraceae bacterium]
MSLRRRLVLLAAGTVGVTVVLASFVCYFAMRAELRDQVDGELMRQAERGGPPGPPRHGDEFRPPPPQRPGEGAANAQLVLGDGTVRTGPDAVAIPVTEDDLALARSGPDTPAEFTDRDVSGEHVRVLTVPLPFGALQLSRSLESVDSTLSQLRVVLVLLCLLGTAFALGVSRLFARQVVAPVTQLTETAEHITATDDLGRRIESAGGSDEVGRMASRFNAMLDRLQASRDALGESVASQRQLVADASHELRTPVTSLRTNVEVLLDDEGASLSPEERRRLLADMREQSEELTLLINDVIELARGDQPLTVIDDVRLDEVVAEAVARARRNAPAVTFASSLEPVVVRGDAERLGRAVSNLLDNAAKHSSEVEVTVRDGEVAVRDHGPGVPDAEKPLIFDRFYRGATARGRPGSGLGLAIVRQVAEAHGAEVAVEDAAGGGALFRMRPGRQD